MNLKLPSRPFAKHQGCRQSIAGTTHFHTCLTDLADVFYDLSFLPEVSPGQNLPTTVQFRLIQTGMCSPQSDHVAPPDSPSLQPVSSRANLHPILAWTTCSISRCPCQKSHFATTHFGVYGPEEILPLCLGTRVQNSLSSITRSQMSLFMSVESEVCK